MKHRYLFLLCTALIVSAPLAGCGQHKDDPGKQTSAEEKTTKTAEQTSTTPAGTATEPTSEKPTKEEPTTVEPTTEASTTVEPTTEASTTARPTTAETNAPSDKTETTTQKTINTGFRTANGLVAYRDTAYELYTYVDGYAANYASIITKAANRLSGAANVYNLVVPTSTGVVLPEEIKTKIDSSDQKESLAKLQKKVSDKVTFVPVYDVMKEHASEYIYFRTDHHWTALGAYYTYTSYCKAAGLATHALAEYETDSFPGFLGSFYTDLGEDAALGNNPDTLNVYYPVSRDKLTMNVTEISGNTFVWPVVYDVSDYSPSFKYSAFIAGDNPLTVITHDDVTEPKTSIVVIKESFGNAFVPFLTDHYDTIYVIDYRYWDGDLVSFVKEKKIQNVLFLNNIGMTRSSYLIGKLSQIVK